jgi:PAS domain S-box-containing protein
MVKDQKNMSEDELWSKINSLEETVSNLLNIQSSIISSIPFPAWIKDTQGRYLSANAFFSQLTGKSIDELRNRTDAEVFGFTETSENLNFEIKLLEQNKSIHTSIIHNNQKFSVLKSALLDAESHLKGVLGIEMEERVNDLMPKALELLKFLTENTRDYIYLKDNNLSYIWTNRSLLELLNVKDESEVVGKDDSSFFSSQFIEKRKEYEKQVLKTSKPILNVEEILLVDDTEIWLSSNFSPLLDEKGNTVGIIGFSNNLTRLKILLNDLERESTFLQLLMDNIPYTIYFKDTKGRFTKINKAQALMLGLKSPEEATGKTDFDFFDPPTAQMTFDDEQKIIKQGTPLIEKMELIKDRNGRSKWVSATKIPVKNAKGEIMGIVGISIDITERRKEEERLREAKEKAEESDRLKTAFLANMSHEIRTPMNGIIGFSNLLRAPDLSENDKNEFIDFIINCGNTLLNLIDDIIDISKIEAGQLKLRFGECNINQMLEELNETFLAIMQKENKEHIKLIMHKGLPDNKAVIFTDSSRLRQILYNLLSNALKFTINGEIKFGYSMENERMLKFFVKDTGIGIPKDKQQMIFERFGQVTDLEGINKKGTGLGLTISYNLACLLGGNLWVESEPQKGSTFYFILPYQIVDNQTIALASATDEKKIDELLRGMTILIAEDEEYNFQYLKYLLAMDNTSILWAKNGHEAVDMVKNNPDISLILMDFKMPDMDGFAATSEIKKIFPHIPIIAQTAYSDEEELSHALDSGCVGYVTKPVSKNQLWDQIRKALIK